MTNLLATKLYRPSIPPRRVQRPRLLQRLNEGLEAGHLLTLVSAPAGFGKTTCISEWVDGSNLPYSWLSLDPADDDPGRFFTYFVAALQKVDENLGREIEGILHAGQLPPGEVISTTLINDILKLERSFFLVLDDFHVIQDRFILHVLERLSANLRQSLHLVLLTREDPSLPLARLRANNLLTEIRAADLNFTRPEIDCFMNEVMGLSLSQTDITRLAERTEGWIAGLQLAGLSVRDRTNPSSYIASLSGSHRFILSYLTEEVLSQQPEAIQRFLLETSILDRLSGDLCNAVTGQTGSHLLLEQLCSANLFLIPLDDEQHWYRYHHLFADLLRNRQNALQKDQTAGLHQRASRWYAQASKPSLRFDERAVFASEAIQHAMAAADYRTAVSLIESHAMEMIMQWYAKTVSGWIQALPPEWSSQNPKTNLAFARIHLMHGDFAQAAPYLERLAGMFSGSQRNEEPALKADWLALQSTLFNYQGKPAEGLELAKQALEIAPENDGYVRSQIYMGLAGAYQGIDDYPHAVDAYQQLIQLGRATANIICELMGISGLALMVLQRGQLRYGLELATQGIERVEHSGALPPISAGLYGEIGQVYYHWHQIDEAQRNFQRAAQVSALSGFSDAELYDAVIRSRLYHIQGDLDAAAREVQKAVDRMQVEAPAVVLEEVIAQQVRVFLARDQLAAAEAALKLPVALSEMSFRENPTYPQGMLYNSALRILLYRAQVLGERASLRQAVDLADQLIAGLLQRQYIPIVLETLLLRAQIQTVHGDEQAGLADTTRALELAEPEGFISVFIEGGAPVAAMLERLLEQNQLTGVQPGYIKRILAAFSQSTRPGPNRPAPIRPDEAVEPAIRTEPADQIDPADHIGPAVLVEPAVLIEPLTDRELDVLRLIARGLKYEEITEQLYISLNTVRTHVKGIYGKLNVNNRTKAIEKAHQLKIL